MIDHEMRSKGIGASEVASILGMDPRRDAFAVWARKLNLVEEPESNVRMRKGKYFERGIVDWYSDETGFHTVWSDTTMCHPDRTWQVVTPDAFAYETNHGVPVNNIDTPQYQGGVDAKLVSFDQRDGWGEPGTDRVPDHYGIQNQWTCSALDKQWWDIAAAIGDELRIYRIHRDPQIEAVLLEVVDKFWRENVLGRTQPPIGATETAKAYLKQRFPKNVEPLRQATPEETELLKQYKALREEWDILEPKYDAVENQVREAIGDAEGLLAGAWKITFRKDKDSTGTDWQAVAQSLERALAAAVQYLPEEFLKGVPTITELEEANQIITRTGPRKLRPTFGKKGK